MSEFYTKRFDHASGDSVIARYELVGRGPEVEVHTYESERRAGETEFKPQSYYSRTSIEDFRTYQRDEELLAAFEAALEAERQAPKPWANGVTKFHDYVGTEGDVYGQVLPDEKLIKLVFTKGLDSREQRTVLSETLTLDELKSKYRQEHWAYSFLKDAGFLEDEG